MDISIIPTNHSSFRALTKSDGKGLEIDHFSEVTELKNFLDANFSNATDLPVIFPSAAVLDHRMPTVILYTVEDIDRFIAVLDTLLVTYLAIENYKRWNK